MDWERYYKAVALEEAGKISEALSELLNLVGTSEDPVDNELVYVGIANCLRQLGRHAEAREFVDKAYACLDEKNQYYPSVIFIDASIDQETGNCAEALRKLDSILENYSGVLEHPDHQHLKTKVLGNRGYALVEVKRYAEARPLLEIALRHDYWRRRTLSYLGVCCFHLQDYEAAKKYLNEALTLELDANYALWVHYYLGLMYLWEGQSARARQELQWCLEHNSGEKVPKGYILKGLVKASEALGLEDDARRFSNLLRSN